MLNQEVISKIITSQGFLTWLFPVIDSFTAKLWLKLLTKAVCFLRVE